MNITELENLAQAATPGPWKFEKDGYVKSCVVPEIVCSPHSCLHETAKTKDHMRDLKGTAKFIAAANPQTILAMIELLREMADALDYASNVIEGEWPVDQWQENGVHRNHAVLAKYKEMTKCETS